MSRPASRESRRCAIIPLLRRSSTAIKSSPPADGEQVECHTSRLWKRGRPSSGVAPSAEGWSASKKRVQKQHGFESRKSSGALAPASWCPWDRATTPRADPSVPRSRFAIFRYLPKRGSKVASGSREEFAGSPDRDAEAAHDDGCLHFAACPGEKALRTGRR